MVCQEIVRLKNPHALINSKLLKIKISIQNLRDSDKNSELAKTKILLKGNHHDTTSMALFCLKWRENEIIGKKIV